MSEGHIHPHHEHPSPTHNYVEANKEFFDVRAETFDQFPGAEEMARRVTKAILAKYPDLFNEETTTIMDFACGTGLISKYLIPHAKSIVGVDISQGVVDNYNMRVYNQGLAPSEMKAIRTELEENDEQLAGAKFDVIVCSAAYHHLPSVEDMTRTLASYLKAGGSLLVADLMKKIDGREIISSEHHHVVAHTRGFGEDDMRRIFTQAGLEDIDFTHLFSVKLLQTDQDIFLARGVKPP